MKRVRTFCLLTLFLVGCQTPPKKNEPATTAQTQKEIDYKGLKNSLGLSRPYTQLGFSEAAFDTCQKGFNLPENSDCQKNYFVTVNFRLQCRHSSGTVSRTLTNEDIDPIANASVRWNLRNLSGTTTTDENGYGQLEIISPISQSAQRLRLAVGTEFLYIRAGEINRVVTPGSWCD